MMPKTLAAELMREPFVPLAIVVSDGRRYVVHNPNLCMIAGGALFIARTDRPNSRLSDDMHVVSLRHIVSIEQVEGQSDAAA